MDNFPGRRYTTSRIAKTEEQGALRMNVLVIDGQGGGLGKQLVAAIKENLPGVVVTAVGTNNTATGAMLKAGADNAATGENAVLVGSRKADVIVGPIGIVIADSLLGEVTPAMAAAVGQSGAKKLLIPISQCGNIVVGIADLSVGRLVQQAVDEIRNLA